MKLYLFSTGLILGWKDLIVPGSEKGVRMISPVPFFLIEHGSERILFDTGQCVPEQSPRSDASFIPLLAKEEELEGQLAKAGFSVSDITRVILSHCHSDHIEGLRYLNGQPCLVQHAAADESVAVDVLRNPQMDWQLLDGKTDVLGDGRIWCVPTPGHTPGHQSLQLFMDDGSEFVLTGDAAYVRKALEVDTLPGVGGDGEAYVSSLEWIRSRQRAGARVITGHDPEDWATLQLAPLYYTSSKGV